MSATDTDKLDCVPAKMDQQERKLNSILQKLESLESSQKQTAQDVKDLKDGYGYLEKQVDEVKSDIAEKASRAEIATLERKIDDLENRSKRNNVVLWGLREDAENGHNSLEAFLSHNFFENHMGLQNIEVMRAHRTNVTQRPSTANGPTPRPIHVYLLRYTDKKLEEIKENSRGPGYWKLNTALLANEEYKDIINNQLPIWLEEAKDLKDPRSVWD
ncbi:hypothetical protein OS493_038464 [Desmophyllum pertusum]|uniref:Uncharacterized protein n=1 Tax=Desmophyllum pertusum TaxID=174260 RepID=A0A9W9ZVN5_9CNID|nr:hypothetical protein OS493_038464 [Desmophyllum pertusum]